MNPTPPNLPVAILAGGLATRLQPLTTQIPKSLLPVADRPFLAHQLDLLRGEDLRQIVLCVGHLGEQIQDAFGDGHNLGLQIQYAFDGPTLLGTGGALRQALPLLGPRFFVLYGDSYLPTPFRPIAECFLRSGKKGLMTVYQNDNRYDTSNVWFNHGQIVRYDKTERLPQMRHIDYGLSLLSQEAFEPFPANTRFDLADLLQRLVDDGQLAGFEVPERFYEIGSPAGLQELETLLRTRPPEQG